VNLVLSFIHPSKPSREVGPFSSVRIDAETVRDGVDWKAIARHREHQWEVEGERYYRLDATTRVRVHFEHTRSLPHTPAKSRSFGPYGRFSTVDGVAYADDRVFAFVDARIGDWFCYGDGRHWAVMVVTDVGTGSPKDRLRAAIGFAPLAAGVIGLWEGAKLLYLGRAHSIRGQLEVLASEPHTLHPRRVTAVTWECHSEPAAREAELYAEYLDGSRSLLHSYGRTHGTAVRTSQLIDRAYQAVELARTLRGRAQHLREQSSIALATARMAAAPL